jgi:hypothetical protein
MKEEIDYFVIGWHNFEADSGFALKREAERIRIKVMRTRNPELSYCPNFLSR